MKRVWGLLLLFALAAESLANDLLTEIEARVARADVIQGRFSQQKKLKFLSKPLLSAGEFVFLRERGVLWRTLLPVSSSLLIGPHRLIGSQGEQPIPGSVGRIFPMLLSGDLSRLSSDFSLSGSIDAAGWRLQLIPVDALVAKVISQIAVQGDTALRVVEISETSGNSSEIRFENISYPKQISPELAAEFEPLSP